MKRSLSMFLCVVMLLGIVPMQAYASAGARTSQVEYTQSSMNLAPDPGLPENNELYAGYVEQLFYGNRVSAFGTAAGKRLSGDEKLLYDALVPLIRQIASGQRTSSTLCIGQEVVYDGTVYPVDAEVVFTQPQMSWESVGRVLDALLADLPYEMYWYDKVSGCQASIIYGSTMLQICLGFTVADNYRGDDYYSVDSTTIKAATTAAANAKKLVSTYASKLDYEKLVAYKNEICSLVSYDFDAAESGDFSWDNDPWQLIHVFDGDPSTNVVCEGYSKAFMYLCDMTAFSGDVSCYTVTGTMDGGNHMWNVVAIDGGNYLVDITNSDAGTVGQNGGFFLTGASGSAASGYEVSGYMYQYSEDTKNLWGTGAKSILTLNDTAYAPDWEISGNCGTNLTWTLVSDGVLFILGTGDMENYASGGAPWYSYRSQITQVVIGSGVTSIGNNALANCTAVKAILFMGNAPAISGNSFLNVSATACYPEDDTTWTSGKRVGYGGTIYWVPVCVKLDAPVVRASNDAATGKIKLTWDAVDGAVEYEVYRATSKNGTYKLMKTTTGTSYTNTSAVAGNTYYYKVVAVSFDAAGNSDYSEIKSRTCDLPRPVVTASNVASNGKIKLSWDTIDGAVEYKVYRATSKNGTYKLMKTTTNTSYTNTSAEAGNSYYYKVVAVHEKSAANSSYSEIKSRTCDLPRPVVTASNVASSGKIKLSWDTIDGAVEYKVYRATSKNGTYKLMKTTTNTSYTNTSAEAGNSYYYKVVAVHEKSAANSSYSEIKSRTCDLPRPVVTASNVASSGKIKLSWDAIDGAVEYKVYRATSKNGTYKLMKTTTNTSYTNTSAEAGNSYYYKVVAVHEKSAANSSYSEVKSRTCDLPRPVISVTLNSSGKPVVSWNSVSGAVQYKVYMYDVNGDLVQTTTTTKTKLTYTSAVAGKTYTYRAVAVHSNTNANSAKSTGVSIKCK